jgi:hypothetical protein
MGTKIRRQCDGSEELKENKTENTGALEKIK